MGGRVRSERRCSLVERDAVGGCCFDDGWRYIHTADFGIRRGGKEGDWGARDYYFGERTRVHGDISIIGESGGGENERMNE